MDEQLAMVVRELVDARSELRMMRIALIEIRALGHGDTSDIVAKALGLRIAGVNEDGEPLFKLLAADDRW